VDPVPTSPTLSVVLPNYNHAQCVGRAITALLAQERPADEIIIVDDGSTDDSMRVIETFAAAAPAIRVLANARNQGVIPALQRGLESARGKYVYFAAADDYVLPGFFALALRRLEANPDLGLFCGESVLVDGRSDRPFAVRPATRPIARAGRVGTVAVRELLQRTDNWILTGSAVFRRDCIRSAGGLDPRLGSFADGWLSRKIALTFGFFFEPTAVATWVVFPDSVSRRTAREIERAQHFLEAVPALIAADAVFPEWYAALFRERWRFATCRLALQASPIDKSFVLAIGARSTAERAQLALLLSVPGRRLPRLLALALLWYRLRPTSLAALLRTMLALRTVRLVVGFRWGQFRSKTTAPATSAGTDRHR
jgi:glycosyltransferase involved in cell wall biosynthesis